MFFLTLSFLIDAIFCFRAAGVNAIGSAGMASLARTLISCSACPLRILGLYRNNGGDGGAVAMARVVEANSLKLSSLFLGGNSVGNEGAIALASALSKNTHLKVGTCI